MNNSKHLPFDVTSSFTDVSSDFTIDVILKQIYDQSEINANLPKQEMKYFLLLYTKNVYFRYKNDNYTQTDDVAMGSPLRSVIAGKFTVKLERTSIATFEESYGSLEKLCG